MTNQTTRERLWALAISNIGYEDGAERTIATISAELDDLRERNAFLLTSAETAQAKLAECRAEMEKLTPYAQAAINTLRAERSMRFNSDAETTAPIAKKDYDIWHELRARYDAEYPDVEAGG